MTASSRIYKLDNIKFILVFLVVFGHLCEHIYFNGSSFLYLLIYSFHMPAFAFVSGYCSKPKPGENIFRQYIVPYIIFQILYISFAKYILKADINFQFTTPYWILWYLMALLIWHLVISVLGENEALTKKLFLFSIPMALLSGYDSTIGYYLSLSRIIVMAPFFFGGYAFKRNSFSFKNVMEKYKHLKKYMSLLGGILMFSLLYLYKDTLNAAWAYHSSPYQPDQCNILIRVFFLIAAAIFTSFLFTFVPDIKIPLLTYIGQNTLGIFLLHGFLIRYLAYKNIIQNITYPQITTVLLTITILLLFSSKPVNMILRVFMK